MAFVNYADKVSCPLAISALDGRIFNGLKLKVSVKINKTT